MARKTMFQPPSDKCRIFIETAIVALHKDGMSVRQICTTMDYELCRMSQKQIFTAGRDAFTMFRQRVESIIKQYA